MKTMFKSFSLLAVAACAGMSITSCTADKDLYNPEVVEENVKAEYVANFVKKFGAVNPAETWDFTSGSTYYLADESAPLATRATGSYAPTVGDYYNVEKETLNWLTNTLEESKDNRKLGQPFAMQVPGNSFTIVPIYQGQAGMTWDLHMVVGTGENAVDTKIWTKSQGIQTGKTGRTGNVTWTNLATSENTLSAEKVRSKQYTFENMPKGETIYFYLEITSGMSGWATKDTKQSSLSGMMLTLECPRPSNISDDHEVKIIGCEDANLKSSDWDLNDIVFLVIGNPEAPKPIEVTEDKVIEKEEKRYMIEDLGATDDFDFNDVVVDVKQERTVTYVLENGVIDYSKTKYGEWKQVARFKHLGGTLPFTVKIGNTVINDIAPAMGYDFNNDEEGVYDITGWDPNDNNIIVTVKGKENEGVKTITFPKKGEVPMIIAVNTKQNWMTERTSIPESWWTVEVVEEEGE
ncbi:MAG: hypothetical protein MJZ73_03485 [Bacteroidaceae bacterium]|nr:hypothetical protein [Bacteroidaceae bacterium]